MGRCIAKWREYAPNLTDDKIIKATCQTPLDIEERIINMREGGVFMGRMNLAQMEHFRPLPELAQFRTPIQGLYLGGACMHPGGGIIGAPVGLLEHQRVRMTAVWDFDRYGEPGVPSGPA